MRKTESGDAPRVEQRQTDETRAAEYLAIAERMLGVCDSVKREEERK